MTTELVYGTAPGATEERMIKSERFYSATTGKFTGPNLKDPLTIQAETIFNSLDVSCANHQSTFYRNEDIKKLIGSLGWNLGVSDWTLQNKLSKLVGGIEDFRSGTAELIQLMELAGKRARYEGRKKSIKRAISILESRVSTFMDIYKTMSSTHVLLQNHFIAQRCETPHRKSVSNEKLAIFYEPLYSHRDKYFLEPSGENLLNYLKCWEHLINEPYYKKYILKSGKKRKRKRVASEVQVLADELEIYALMEVAR